MISNWFFSLCWCAHRTTTHTNTNIFSLVHCIATMDWFRYRLMKCTISMLLSLYTNRQPRRIEFALRLTAFKYRISYKFLRAAAAVFSLCYCFKCNKIPFYFVCHKTCSVRARSIENMLWLGEKAPLLWCSFTQLIHKPNRCRIPFHSIDLCGVFLSVTQEIHLINRKKYQINRIWS